MAKRKQLARAETMARLAKPDKQAMRWKRKWVAGQVHGQRKDGLGFR